MKKTLLSIALIGSAFAASSQELLNENFNSYPVGNLGTNIDETAPNQGNWFIYGTSAQKSEIVTVGTNDNGLKLTGSATSGTRYNTRYLKSAWNKRTAGNNVLFVSFIFETPATQNASRNSFEVNIPDSITGAPLIGVSFENLTNKLTGIFYDSLKTSATATVGTKTVFSQKLAGATDVVLENGKAYYVEMRLDKTTGDIYWRGLDITGATPVSKFNIYRTQVKKSSGVAGFEVIARSGNIAATATTQATLNTASTTFTIDDIIVKARPCYSYDVKANAAFSYASGSNCIGGSNLVPVLVSPTSTGVFSTTATSGLSLDPNTGTINMASNSGTLKGDYSVKFVTVDPYAPASGSTAAIPGACEDSVIVNVKILNCAGIEENNVSSYSIFPNPANDFISVSFSDLAENKGTIRLLSADGKVIETRNFSNATVETFDVQS